MRFFVARMVLGGGDWSYPWTVWAPTYAEALSRLMEAEDVEPSEVHIRERPRTDAAAFGHPEESSSTVLEHVDMSWAP